MMKKFVLMSFLTVAAIMLFFAANARELSQSTKINNVDVVVPANNKAVSGEKNERPKEMLLEQKSVPDADLIKAFNKSVTFENEKKYKEAIEVLDKVYSLHSGEYLINLRLGWLYYNLKVYDKSKEYYSKTVAIDVKSVESYLGLRLALAALNDWEAVQKVYGQILQIDPRNYEANLRLGIIKYNLGNYTDAKKYLDIVLSDYPSTYEINLWYGWTCFQLRDYTLAKRYFNQVLMISENDSSALEGLQLIK